MKPSLQKRNPDMKNCKKVHYAVDWCLSICSSLRCSEIQVLKCRLNTRQFAKLRSNKPVLEKENSLVVHHYLHRVRGSLASLRVASFVGLNEKRKSRKRHDCAGAIFSNFVSSRSTKAQRTTSLFVCWFIIQKEWKLND